MSKLSEEIKKELADETEPRLKMVNFRILEQEWESLKTKAESDGLTVSQVIRKFIEKYLKD